MLYNKPFFAILANSILISSLAAHSGTYQTPVYNTHTASTNVPTLAGFPDDYT